MRSILHFAIADFRERSRRYSFLITLVLILYLGYVVYQSDLIIMVGQYRGINNGAWAGNLMALSINTFLGLGGFYLIKNSISRDAQTRVGQIIATTPNNDFTYLMGKWVSHIILLTAILAVLFGTTCLLQILTNNFFDINFLHIVTPFLFLSFPIIAFLAGITLLFEVTPVLRSGIGNVIYFFIFMLLLMNSFELFSKQPLISDPLGIQLISNSMELAAKEAFPEFGGGFSFLTERKEILGFFPYQGISWSLQNIASRIIWFLSGFFLVLLSTPIFRFSKNENLAGNWFSKKYKKTTDSQSSQFSFPANNSSIQIPSSLSRLPRENRRFSLLRILQKELLLLTRGYPWWSMIILFGLNIAVIFSSLEITRTILLPIAWGIPILAWSKMGCRESEYNTYQFILSSPKLLSQNLATYLAGFSVCAVSGIGALIMFSLDQDTNAILGWISAIFFIPALAWSLGSLTGTSRTFEFVYAFMWFFGPIQGVTVLDFMGINSPMSQKLYYLSAAFILLIGATFVRQFRNQY